MQNTLPSSGIPIHRGGVGAARKSSLAGFFEHHGVWAPGVRLFRTMQFAAKAAIVTAAFMIPIGVLAWSYYSTKGGNIEFSAKEHLGVAYARDTLPVLKAAIQLRMRADASAARAEVDAALKKLEVTEQALGAELGTAKLFTAVKEAHGALAAAGGRSAKRRSPCTPGSPLRCWTFWAKPPMGRT